MAFAAARMIMPKDKARKTSTELPNNNNNNNLNNHHHPGRARSKVVRYDYQNNHLIICLMSDGKYHLSDIKNNKIKIYQLNFKKFSFNLC